MEDQQKTDGSARRTVRKFSAEWRVVGADCGRDPRGRHNCSRGRAAARHWAHAVVNVAAASGHGGAGSGRPTHGIYGGSRSAMR